MPAPVLSVVPPPLPPWAETAPWLSALVPMPPPLVELLMKFGGTWKSAVTITSVCSLTGTMDTA